MTEPTHPGRILRHEIPVDDQFHALHIGGIIHIATRRRFDVVEVWATDTDTTNRRFTVVGTGHPIPEVPHHRAEPIGTAITPGGGLVWHLIEYLDVTP